MIFYQETFRSRKPSRTRPATQIHHIHAVFSDELPATTDLQPLCSTTLPMASKSIEMLTLLQDNEVLLDLFQTPSTTLCAFVIIPPGMTFDQLRQKRPFSLDSSDLMSEVGHLAAAVPQAQVKRHYVYLTFQGPASSV